MTIELTSPPEQPLRVISLGSFSSEIVPLTPRLAAINAIASTCTTLAQLPATLDEHDVVLTDSAWLNQLTPVERTALSERTAMVANWIVLNGENASFNEQIAWQCLGASHFFPQPLDLERLATLLEDMHEKLHGPALRVILCDADASSLAQHAAALQDAGIVVLTARQPLQALEALYQFKPDLLLLGVTMEACDGADLSAIARQQAEFAYLPIIFIATADVMQQMLLTKAARPEDFLINPVPPTLLVTAVQSHGLRHRSTQRRAQQRRQQDAWSNGKFGQLRIAVDEHAIISIADVRGDTVHVNDHFCAISGYSREELLGQNHRMVKSATHPNAFYHDLWQTISAGQTWHGEVCNRRHNGELYWVDATIVPFLDDKGKPTQYISISTDITSLKHSEEALRLSEERFSFAVEGAGDGISDWNITSGERPLSGHYEAMLGYEKGEIEPSARAWMASIHADDQDRMQRHLHRYLTGESPAYHVQLRQRCKDGSYKWILCRGTVVARDGAGNPIRMIGIHSNINERMAVEAALVEARESAERANHAKSAFLSSMSHELRTPMNAILGFSQMLEYDSTLTADQQDNVHEILKGGRHLLELINEVLDLAKIESGHIDLSIEPVELAGLIEDCRQMILPLAAARRIGLRLQVPPSTAVRADRTRLKQVLLNLLSNAIKYNREGGEIRLGLQTETSGLLRISVADDGRGIAPEHLGQLFQPFSRINAQHYDIEGTGIGLTITRNLVELMGGKVGVDSEVDIGSTFWIELPSSLPAQCAGSDDGIDISAAIGMPAQRFRVLCVDDNPVNLKLITQMLRLRPAIHLISAHAPELGIELALAHRPDLILLDINMPVMDGYQVLDVLRADARLSAIPVIAVTANAMPRDIEHGHAAGFIDYLTKPLDVGHFLRTIDHFLLSHEERAA
jgi:PAS domain S-box-containing protein